MADWSLRMSLIELTFELGRATTPAAAMLPLLWLENRQPMLNYIEQVRANQHEEL